MKSMIEPSADTCEIFCIFAPEDRAVLADLDPYRDLLLQQGEITAWRSLALAEFDEWSQGKAGRYQRDTILVVLLSPDTLRSNIWKHPSVKHILKPQKALRRLALTVELCDVAVKGTPLGHLHSLLEGKSLSQWISKEVAWYEVFVNLQEVIALIRDPSDRPEKVEVLEQRLRKNLVLYEQTFGPHHPAVASTLSELVTCYGRQNKEDEAFFRHAFAVIEPVYGPTSIKLASCLACLADLYGKQGKDEISKQMFQRALQIYQQENEETEIAPLLDGLAENLSTGRADQRMMELEKRLLRVCEQEGTLSSPDVIEGLVQLATRFDQQGDETEAEFLYQCLRAIHQHLALPTHPDASSTLSRRAALAQAGGHLAQAESLLLQAHALRHEVLGPAYPGMRRRVDQLVALYVKEKKEQEAEALLFQSLCEHEQVYGLSDSSLVECLDALAIWYERQGKSASEIQRFVLRALTVTELAKGIDHPDTAAVLYNTAKFYVRHQGYEQAEEYLQRALSIWEQQSQPISVPLAQSLDLLAHTYEGQGKSEQAASCYQRLFSVAEEMLAANDPTYYTSVSDIAVGAYQIKEYTRAAELYERVLVLMERVDQPDYSNIVLMLSNLAAIYQAQGKEELAESVMKRALAMCEQREGPHHPQTAGLLNNLWSLYYIQGQYWQAEPLLRRALSLLEKSLGPTHPEVAELLESHATLLRKLNRESEAKIAEARAKVIRARQA